MGCVDVGRDWRPIVPLAIPAPRQRGDWARRTEERRSGSRTRRLESKRVCSKKAATPEPPNPKAKHVLARIDVAKVLSTLARLFPSHHRFENPCSNRP